MADPRRFWQTEEYEAMLNVHSYFSFKYGMASIKGLIEWALANHIRTLALTDINSTAGSLEFVRLCEKNNIRPILGIDFRQGASQHFVGIARNNEGFFQLNRLLSHYLHNNAPLPRYVDALKHCFIIYPIHNLPPRPLWKYEYVAVQPYEVNKKHLFKNIPPDKLIAAPTFTLMREDDFDLHAVLRAIDENTLVSKLTAEDTGRKEHLFLEKKVLLDTYRSMPQAFDNLKHVVSKSRIRFDFGTNARPQNLKTFTGTEEGDYRKVRELCRQGLCYRYGSKPSLKVMRRIVGELSIIRQKGFMPYFLISWDIVRYARSKGYFYVGRGSGANSVVAYLLRITDVDPIDLELYFERFINLFRQNPPDFDMDFSSNDRDDVTRYIFQRYGNAVLLATHSTFQFRAVTREVGKAFGVPPYEIEKLQAKPDGDLDSQSKLILKYGNRLTGFPSHLSVHAGGILIAEKPIHYFTATTLPPKGFPITHFDMLIAEDVGLFKFDILGQRGLGKIRDTLTVVKQNRPQEPAIDIHNIKAIKEDPLIRQHLRAAKAIGCFYVESPAMRMLLTKLRAGDYLALVAASSIIRPGVSKSGMMREYIQRFRKPEKRKEAHPVLWDIMPDTYGVMVYQEDVIKVAHYFAGLTLGEADVLRRGMSGKYRSREEFRKVKDKFFFNCKKKGYADSLSHDVWRQIESFAGYAFAKGHSASYAIESYQSMYLKCHYPLEFMVSVINNGGGFYRTEFYIHEARMCGAAIEAPCVNTSRNETIIQDKTIFIGLGFLKGLEQHLIHDLLAERGRNGRFVSVDDFVKRVSVSLEQVSILIRIGAFRFMGENKKKLLWRAHFLLGNTGKSQTAPSLFDPPVRQFRLPEITITQIENAHDEMELLGFPLCRPFYLLEHKPPGVKLANDLPELIGERVEMLGYLVTTKPTSTAKGDRMFFGTYIDEAGEFIDTVHFPPVARQFPFTGSGIYHLRGTVIEEFEAITLEVEWLSRLNYVKP
jgi:DNA polymerase-3 subunit alpha